MSTSGSRSACKWSHNCYVQYQRGRVGEGEREKEVGRELPHHHHHHYQQFEPNTFVCLLCLFVSRSSAHWIIKWKLLFLLAFRQFRSSDKAPGLAKSCRQPTTIKTTTIWSAAKWNWARKKMIFATKTRQTVKQGKPDSKIPFGKCYHIYHIKTKSACAYCFLALTDICRRILKHTSRRRQLGLWCNRMQSYDTKLSIC